MSRDDLIERLEAATGPDRELDAAIANMLGHALLTWEMDGKRHTTARDYTASIDAALTLVPEGWGWVDLEIAPKAATASLNNCKRMVEARASTPALAIVIAALRATLAETQP